MVLLVMEVAVLDPHRGPVGRYARRHRVRAARLDVLLARRQDARTEHPAAGDVVGFGVADIRLALEVLLREQRECGIDIAVAPELARADLDAVRISLPLGWPLDVQRL